ncbi:TrbI/VirB10 family protein [Paracoccus versutus]|uniref:Type IV secretion system protein VirB10 n=1 Tax=Paracoccus versutus TaxID=34007 RepID=A0A3D9XT21_PARVE|nr:TrbI/VirB10 family protein [Paracoccus versutus]REF73587.1 type IV secretion system protein VirB10 [Paracoccus versutus]WGR54845.1 TrbI/VirB10 family protein [Paracoccus versutus]
MTGKSSDSAAPMRLHAEPPKVTRLSRKALTAFGLVASLAIGGALIYALQPRDRNQGGEELFSTENRATADGLADLPRDYSGPVLGPPLPGDLGKPILEAQNRGEPVMSPAITPPAADPDGQRRLAEEEAARVSQLFFETSQPTGAAPVAGQPGMAGIGTGGMIDSPTSQTPQQAFLNAAPDRQPVSAERIMTPASPYLLQAGAVIPAALITGIRSDLPGQIVAQVTENVYDSPSGRYLLIPQGTRVIGEYSDAVGFGQRRVLLVWNRLIFPDGRSLVLGRLPGADAQGFAGLEDGVDYHWAEMAKAAGLSTILAIGTGIGSEDDDPLVRAIREGAGDTIADAGQQIVERQLQVAPTLTIRQGFPVRILVTKDLVLEPRGG